MGSFIRIVLLAVAAASIIAGCGGGGGATATDDETAAPSSSPQDMQFVAIANSASTVSLGWKAVPGAASLVIERKSGGGPYAPIATLHAGASCYLDAGLARNTTYAYRLIALGASQDAVAERSATTGDEEPMITSS